MNRPYRYTHEVVRRHLPVFGTPQQGPVSLIQ
jgi:hypothetical protein